MDAYHHGMSIAMSSRVPTAAEVAALDAHQIATMLRSQAKHQIEALQRQIEWFKRQVFGRKSERFAPEPEPQQMHLGQVLGEDLSVPEKPAGVEQVVPAHKRRRARSDFTNDTAAAHFFDEAKVPVQTIELPAAEAKDLRPEQYKVVGSKTSYRLTPSARRLCAPEVRACGNQAAGYADAALRARSPGGDRGQPRRCELHRGRAGGQVCLAPAAYRQHQRLDAAGFKLGRPWLTQLVQQAALLLEPIYRGAAGHHQGQPRAVDG